MFGKGFGNLFDMDIYAYHLAFSSIYLTFSTKMCCI